MTNKQIELGISFIKPYYHNDVLISYLDGILNPKEVATDDWLKNIINLLKKLKGDSKLNLEIYSDKPCYYDKFDEYFSGLNSKEQSNLKRLVIDVLSNILDSIRMTYDFDDFVNKFSKEFFHITDANVDQLNLIINLDGKKLDKQSIDNEQIKLTTNQLYALQKLVIVIAKLKSKGITPKSYASKMVSFEKFKIKALDEFGIILSNKLPFENPTYAYNKLDFMLSDYGLTKEQKNAFYSLFNIRDRLPKQEHIKIKLDSNILAKLRSDYFNTISHEEQSAILSGDYMFNHSPEYFVLLDKYNIKEIPEEVFDGASISRNIHEENLLSLEYEYWERNIEEEIELDNIFLSTVMLEQNIHKYLSKAKISSILKAIEKYKLFNYIDINQQTLTKFFHN